MDMINAEMDGSLTEQMKRMANQDAFEESSGPIVYMADNRMPAIVEFRSTIVYIIYLALVLVLLIILPGVRKTKFKSLFCLLTMLTVGASILLAMNGSHWLSGHVLLRHIKYGGSDGQSLSGQLEVNIGLNSVNVSLSGFLEDATTTTGGQENNQGQDVMYNERFSWLDPEGMSREHKSALSRGLPYPILTITEYLSHDADGFNWSRRLREAGQFASMFLCAAFLCWLLTAASLCLIPGLLGVLMLITGILMLASVGVYALLIPPMDNLAIRMMGGQVVEFEWGFNFITTHVIGLLTIFAGLVMFVLQEHTKHDEQFTIMEAEQNVINRKMLYGQQMMDTKQHEIATMDSKPNNKLINLIIGSRQTANSSSKSDSISSQSVIIPISDIEQNFRPSN